MSQAMITTKQIPLTGANRHEVQLPKGARIIGVENFELLVEFDPNTSENETAVFHSARVGAVVPAYPFFAEFNTPGGKVILRREPS